MNHKELLKIIASLSSNYNQYVDSREIYESVANDTDQNDVYYLAQDLHNYGFVKLEPHGHDFRVELTSRGAVYLLSS